MATLFAFDGRIIHKTLSGARVKMDSQEKGLASILLCIVQDFIQSGTRYRFCRCGAHETTRFALTPALGDTTLDGAPSLLEQSYTFGPLQDSRKICCVRVRCRSARQTYARRAIATPKGPWREQKSRNNWRWRRHN
ncbi:hypothetical protein TRVL_01272 [Trypanosoma vivax]|nr:hypothetical protein TRVL_01272 [Trypanosoma vivax]